MRTGFFRRALAPIVAMAAALRIPTRSRSRAPIELSPEVPQGMPRYRHRRRRALTKVAAHARVRRRLAKAGRRAARGLARRYGLVAPIALLLLAGCSPPNVRQVGMIYLTAALLVPIGAVFLLTAIAQRRARAEDRRHGRRPRHA